MLTVLEKYWSLISVLFLVALLITLLFWPAASAALAIPLLLLSLGMAILFIVRRQMQAYRAGRIDRAAMACAIFVEVSGLLLTIALAAYLAQGIQVWAVTFASGALSTVIAIVMSLLVGLGIGWLVQRTWGRLARA